MALVMLPCELPWWSSVQRHLKHLLLASTTQKLIDGMLKIHEMCNISIDPEEDEKDVGIMLGFKNFLDNDMTDAERTHFMDNTLPTIIHRALQLKNWKPPSGLVFSLQQQADMTELSYDFVSSLIAHAFFSTYPKRTVKTHPTLQDFNFTYFFQNLNRPFQKSKLKSIFYYFDWIENNKIEGKLKISRQVMKSKQWLTIEDWLECSLPLSHLQIKHESRIERCETPGIEMCFANSRIGGHVLSDSCSQEAITMCTSPELLISLLFIEALEDNEVIRFEGVRRFTKVVDHKNKCKLEVLTIPQEISICLADPENYSKFPLVQYADDNILRELNKCLLGFQQVLLKTPEVPTRNMERRLSPIGESFSTDPPECEATVVIKQTSASTINSFSSRSPSPDQYKAETLNQKDESINLTRNKCYLSPEMNTLNNRRGRFIVLGSSGECLPVKRPTADSCDSLYSSCNSSFEEFHSANTSLEEDSDNENNNKAKQYSLELNTAERRASFAQRLKDALKREMDNSFSNSISTESSYAVGISVTGSGLQDANIKLKRGDSGGFVLAEDSLDEEILEASLPKSINPKPKRSGLGRNDTNDSSKYSFSTEYGSELEEVYEQFSQWLEDPIVDKSSLKNNNKGLDSRDIAVIQFASSLLKRTLSESFAGVPLTDCCLGYTPTESKHINRNKVIGSVRSLSLELAKHKHKLAAQLSLKNSKCENIPEESETDKPENGSDLPESKPLQNPNNELVPNIISDDNANPINPENTNKHPKDKVKKGESSTSRKKMSWVINCITEIIEQNIECEPMTFKIQKSQLSQLINKRKNTGEIKPIITGNWGCGSSKRADPQLKFTIQWLAASVSGSPVIYYANGKPLLFKLDTLLRILVDRKWTVGKLATAMLTYSHQILHEPQVIPEGNTLFDELIGIEKTNQ